MRSSKSRSRNNKPNRNRPSTVGNVVNRVFDSSGPEGKVRGTPQQIIEKYNQLARDAQLSNDRVATENFQQHAEHYLRLLGAAQKEMDEKREQDAKREQQERENRDRQADRDRDRPTDRDQDRAQSGGDDGDDGDGPQPDVAEVRSQNETSTLVDTPESKVAPKQRAPRKPRQKAPPVIEAAPEATAPVGGDELQSTKQDAPRPRRARKPKGEAAQSGTSQSSDQNNSSQNNSGQSDEGNEDRGAPRTPDAAAE